MSKRHSLQWKLTVITAIIVILSCLAISYAISKSAIASMSKIEDSAVAILPANPATDNTGEVVQLQISTKDVISDMAKEFKRTSGKAVYSLQLLSLSQVAL